ncbi:hypothetical protein D9757_011185 [Collybiopsis confluens]|uniref:DUF7918 domain-containing protein n=1 Tax=Collybiopsis confluens TaxID=2823264 RepID=A0A8H5H324_9AGAR|nr:hypothetical protein D9757_011185 [Collybiopsis confluens]
MPTHLSFSASVVVDGAPLKEYNVETVKKGEMTTVTCWIPSEAGKRYEIQWKDSICEQSTQGNLYIDGHGCGSSIARKKNKIMIKRGLRPSETTLSPFEFAPLKMTDDDEAATLEMPRDVGQIKLRIRNFRVEGREAWSTGVALPILQTYSEKAKKGIDHLTSFSGIISGPKKTACIIGQPTGPTFLQFCFRYRPIGILRAQGIAPPLVTAQAEPSSRSRKRARSSPKEAVEASETGGALKISDGEDEIERLQARLDELRAKRPNTSGRKKIKLEPEQTRIKPDPSGSERIVIDLTW